MTISVVCPSCRAKYSLNDNFAGQEVACFGCQEKFQVPVVTASNVQTSTVIERRSGQTNESVNYYAAPVDTEDLRTCPECGEVIGHEVATCPHCQAVISVEESERGRLPLGVRLLAYLNILGAAMSVFGIVTVLSVEDQSRLAMVASIATVIMSGLLNGFVGLGMLKGYGWTWWYMMGTSIASVFSVVRYSLTGGFYGQEMPEEFPAEMIYFSYAVSIVISLICILYFRRTKVKAYFRIKNPTLMNIVFAAVGIFIGSYILLELPSDLISYFEGEEEMVFQGGRE